MGRVSDSGGTPGMPAKPRRRRGSGSLGQLKARLWAVIEYSVALVDDETVDHELRLKGATALVQAALAYSRVLESHSLESRLAALEAVAEGDR
jgi:hypothetical protein